MSVKKILSIIVILIMLSGCTMNKDKNLTLEPDGNQSMQLTKLSTRGTTDQQPSDLAKQYLSNYQEISRVRAVNHDNHILIGVDVEQNDRFALDDIERDVRKEIKQKFSNMKVTVSTDQKILLELKDLENAIHANDISAEDIEKRMNELKKLSNEET